MCIDVWKLTYTPWTTHTHTRTHTYARTHTLAITLRALSGSVNAAFEQWGDKLLKTYGKSRSQTYADYGLNYLR